MSKKEVKQVAILEKLVRKEITQKDAALGQLVCKASEKQVKGL